MNREFWNERYAGAELIWTADANRFLVERAGELEAGRALDLGAGEGRNAVWLAERGWRVHAVDFADRGLDKGRALAAERGVEVEWQQADLLDYAPQPRAYELVLLMYIHLPAAPMRRVIGLAAEAVAPGGTLLVVGHDETNITAGYGGPQDPSILYGPDDVVAAAAGLEIGEALRVERPVKKADAVAIDCLVRATRPSA